MLIALFSIVKSEGILMKIRGFNSKLNKFVHLEINGDGTFEGMEMWHDITPGSIGASTMMPDMAGREAYEGDIIENSDGIRMKICLGVHLSFCPADRAYMPSMGFYAIAPDLPQMPIGSLEDYATIIGNAFENPELNKEFLNIKKEGVI